MEFKQNINNFANTIEIIRFNDNMKLVNNTQIIYTKAKARLITTIII